MFDKIDFNTGERTYSFKGLQDHDKNVIADMIDDSVKKISEYYRVVETDEDLEWNRAIDKVISLLNDQKNN